MCAMSSASQPLLISNHLHWTAISGHLLFSIPQYIDRNQMELAVHVWLLEDLRTPDSLICSCTYT